MSLLKGEVLSGVRKDPRVFCIQVRRQRSRSSVYSTDMCWVLATPASCSFSSVVLDRARASSTAGKLSDHKAPVLAYSCSNCWIRLWLPYFAVSHKSGHTPCSSLWETELIKVYTRSTRRLSRLRCLPPRPMDHSLIPGTQRNDS